MKRRLWIAQAAITLVSASGVASAQPAAGQRYFSVSYMKVEPGKAADFVAHQRTGEGAKLTRALMKANSKMLSYSLRRPFYAGNPAPEANFIAVTAWEGAPTLLEPAKRDEVYKSATGMTFEQYQQKLSGMRTVVGSTLGHMHDMTPGAQTDEGDVIVLQRFKIAPRKTQDFYTLAREYMLPMATERAKAGGLKAWTFSHLVFPSGSSLEWDATISTIYKDFASAMPAGAGGGGAGVALFTTLFPNRNYARFIDDSRESATLVRRELQAVVVSIRP